MLDFRLETFLVLCGVGSYTKAASILHITQPAVSQHIKFLENHYGNTLFDHTSKNLLLTEHGKLLYHFATTISADCKAMRAILSVDTPINAPVHFGATRTIGEFIMPPILKKIIQDYPNTPFSMDVDNTEILLEKLRVGELGFILVEGIFDKSKYDSVCLSKESFIGICQGDNPVQVSDIDHLTHHHLITRERGSGTRDILEKILIDHNLTIDSFRKHTQIGNMRAIKQLVASGIGISFVYKVAVEEELETGEISEMDLVDFPIKREFTMAFTKGTAHRAAYMRWCTIIKELRI